MTISERDELGYATFSNVSAVDGKIAGGQITKGDPLSSDSFVAPGAVIKGQDLATAIAPGRVLIAIEVDQINGVGTLIVPGDYVDVILSVWVDRLEIKATSDDGKYVVDIGGDKDVTTKMVIQNRKVVATLLPMAEATESAAAPAPSGSPSPSSEAEVIVNSGQHEIVLLEVLPEEAEIIRWAQREEITEPQNYITLGLVLRSADDKDAPPVTTQGITFSQLTKLYGVLPLDPRAVLPADIAKHFTW
jgi:Flp pilus assembly protein CpaB